MNGNDQPKPYIPSPEQQAKLLLDAKIVVDEWRHVVLAKNDDNEGRHLTGLSHELWSWRAHLLTVDTPDVQPQGTTPTNVDEALPDLQTALTKALTGHEINVFGVEFETEDADERKPSWKATARVHYRQNAWSEAQGATRGEALLRLLRQIEGACLTRTEHAAIDNLKRVYGL